MTTPAIDWTQHGTTTPSRYRFVLSFVLHSENGTLELVNAPLEWKDIELVLKRDPETHGVNVSAVINSLTFIKEGRNLLIDIYESKGVFSQCSLYIYYLDFVTREYVSMPSTYKLDFNTYRLINLTKTTNGVQINCLPEGIVSKFQQRKNTVIDLNKLKGLSDFTIADYVGLKKSLAMPEINSYAVSKHSNITVNEYSLTIEDTKYITLPINVDFSDFGTEVENIAYSIDSGYDYNNAFLSNQIAIRNLQIKGSISINLHSIKGENSGLNFWFKVLNIDNTVYSESWIFGFTEVDSGEYMIPIDEVVDVPVGKYLCFIAIAVCEAGTNKEVTVDFEDSLLTLYDIIDSVPATTVESFPLYEAIERNLQIILDVQAPLYSEFFGRVDTAHVYATENQLRFASILSGLCLRGATLSNETNTIPVKFMDLFKLLKSAWCVGGGFEEVGGILTFRIEDLAYFYQEDEALDLSARVNELEIEREMNPEIMFSKVKTGYSKFKYESVSGRGEYNTTNIRTTVVPGDNEFDNVIPIRADTRGMLELMLKPIASNGSEDVSGDNEVFVVKTQRGAVADWDAETSENIAIENNTSLFLTGSLNLYLTPLRNLIRNGRILNTGLSLMPGSKIAYQTSDKNTTLRTTGEGITISENEDITTEQLAPPLWSPEILTVTLPFYEADYVDLATTPYGYVKLSEILSGWLLDVRYKFAQNTVTLKLLRRIIPLPS